MDLPRPLKNISRRLVSFENSRVNWRVLGYQFLPRQVFDAATCLSIKLHERVVKLFYCVRLCIAHSCFWVNRTFSFEILWQIYWLCLLRCICSNAEQIFRATSTIANVLMVKNYCPLCFLSTALLLAFTFDFCIVSLIFNMKLKIPSNFK